MAVATTKTTKPITPIYKPRTCFLPFHNRAQRWAVLLCHRRCGKTVAAINELIERALYSKKPNPQFAYISPTLKQSKKIAWRYLKQYAKPFLKKAPNEAELYVELINGAIITIMGADAPDSIRGLYMDGVVLDEFAMMKPSVFSEVIRPLLSDRKGWCVFCGTPAGKVNGLYEIYKRAVAEPDKYFLLDLKASETGIIGPKELAELQEDMEEAEYQQEYENSFTASLKGSYYGKHIEKLSQQGNFKTVNYDAHYSVSLAMDIGYNDATSIWFWQIVDGEVRFIDYWEESGWDAEEVVEKLQLLPYSYETWWIPHDAFHKTFQSKKSAYDTFREFDAPVKRVPDPDAGNRVFHGIDAVRKVLRKFPIVFDAMNCDPGLEALKNYSREWSMRSQQFKDTPAHNRWSHGADAFRYACLSIDPSDIARSIEEMMKRLQVQGSSAPAVIRESVFAPSLIDNPNTLKAAVDHHRRILRRERAVGRERI